MLSLEKGQIWAEIWEEDGQEIWEPRHSGDIYLEEIFTGHNIVGPDWQVCVGLVAEDTRPMTGWSQRVSGH